MIVVELIKFDCWALKKLRWNYFIFVMSAPGPCIMSWTKIRRKLLPGSFVAKQVHASPLALREIVECCRRVTKDCVQHDPRL